MLKHLIPFSNLGSPAILSREMRMGYWRGECKYEGRNGLASALCAREAIPAPALPAAAEQSRDTYFQKCRVGSELEHLPI